MENPRTATADEIPRADWYTSLPARGSNIDRSREVRELSGINREGRGVGGIYIPGPFKVAKTTSGGGHGVEAMLVAWNGSYCAPEWS